MALSITCLAICLVLAIIFISVRTLRGGVAGVLTKTLASVAFVASGIIALSVASGGLNYGLIVIGLVFGLVGDILLDLKVIYPEHQNAYLNAGMLSFGLGHVCYAAGLSMFANGTSTIWLCLVIALGVSIVVAPLIMLISKGMKLDFGKFFIQSLTYAFILVFMVAYSIGLSVKTPLMYISAVGLFLFLASDLVLSLQYFGGKQDSKALIIINHTLYYLAQISLVAFLFFV